MKLDLFATKGTYLPVILNFYYWNLKIVLDYKFHNQLDNF